MCASQAAPAGPPLSIDDPGILGQWQWELITATTIRATSGGDVFQLPVVDFSLGLIADHAQLAVVYPFVLAEPDSGGSNSGVGNPEFGLKWRFLNQQRLQMAFAPYYVFAVDDRAATRGLGSSKGTVVLPVNAEYQLSDRWRLNGELHYARTGDREHNWGYGAAVAYAVDDRWEFLFELSGATDANLANDFVDVRVGLDAAVNSSLHVLFSLATGIAEPTGADTLHYDVFLGIQYFR